MKGLKHTRYASCCSSGVQCQSTTHRSIIIAAGNVFARVCRCVCLLHSYSNFWKPWAKDFIFGIQLYLQNIYIKFVQQDYWIKVKVTAAIEQNIQVKLNTKNLQFAVMFKEKHIITASTEHYITFTAALCSQTLTQLSNIVLTFYSTSSCSIID